MLTVYLQIGYNTRRLLNSIFFLHSQSNQAGQITFYPNFECSHAFLLNYSLQGRLPLVVATVVATGASACSFLSTFMASEEPPAPSQWNPHPTLYRKPFYVVFAVSKDDQSSCSPKMTIIYFQVEDTTFGLDVGGLIQHSDPLREILQIEPADGSEGTENNPIVVNGVTVQRFESFMRWLNHL